MHYIIKWRFGKLPKWLRGHPAKVLGRETGARVQISHFPPTKNRLSKACFLCPSFAFVRDFDCFAISKLCMQLAYRWVHDCSLRTFRIGIPKIADFVEIFGIRKNRAKKRHAIWAHCESFDAKTGWAKPVFCAHHLLLCEIWIALQSANFVCTKSKLKYFIF